MSFTSRTQTAKSSAGWWFQPIWKILIKMGVFPKIGVNIKTNWNHHLDQRIINMSCQNLWKKGWLPWKSTTLLKMVNFLPDDDMVVGGHQGIYIKIPCDTNRHTAQFSSGISIKNTIPFWEVLFHSWEDPCECKFERYQRERVLNVESCSGLRTPFFIFHPHPLKTNMEPQIQKNMVSRCYSFSQGDFFSGEPAFRPCVKTVGWDSSPGLLGDGQQICHMFLVGGGHFTFNPEVRFLTLTL